MKVAEALKGVSRLYLDTAPVVYYFEKNPSYHHLVAPIFERIDSGALQAVTGPITLAECLIHSIRLKLVALQKEFNDFIVRSRNTTFHQIGEQATLQAAELRVRYNMPLLDALQLGVALASGCDAILTNDEVFKRVTEIKVISVNDLEL